MIRILHIETSTLVCSIALAIDGKVAELKESFVRNAHAENITVFSEMVIQNAGLTFNDLDAISVSKGPGSYTGLRIGVSTAKGFCYAMDKPLVAINTLHSMASGMAGKTKNPDEYLFCPMIDARRMEVYAAFFDGELNFVRDTKAVIIDEDSFSDILNTHKVIFGGDGLAKCKNILAQSKNAYFIDEFFPSAAFGAELSYQKYRAGELEDVAYFEPFYLKDFVAGIPRVKGLK